MQHPPDMQSPAKAATMARANCRTEHKHSEFSDDLTDRQASRIARLFLVGYAATALIAALSVGGAK